MKIFGIGLARTGTLSLCHALRILGYSAIHFPRSIAEIEQNDASVDTSVTIGYKFLDLMHPGSKFIYTSREPAGWLDSCFRYWEKFHKEQPEFISKIHIGLYGGKDYHPQAFINAYGIHELDVINYFWGRREDLLQLDICAGQGWEPLCHFLGKPIPDVPFPHEHSWEKITQS